MSFPIDITLTDGSAGTSTVSTISVNESKSIRRDPSAGMATPLSLTISHQVNGKNLKAMDRHLIRLDNVKEDTGSEDLAVISASVYMVVEAPRRIFSEADLLSMAEKVSSFVTESGNFAKIMNGEP